MKHLFNDTTARCTCFGFLKVSDSSFVWIYPEREQQQQNKKLQIVR